jgi:hypothetical protein
MSSNRNSDEQYPYEGGPYEGSSYEGAPYEGAPYGEPSYGQQPYPEQQFQQPQPQPHLQDPQPQSHFQEPAGQDPYATQSWQGQTWDTQYQPVHQPVQQQFQQPAQQPAPQQAPEYQQQSQGQFQQAAADTAYLPPQNGAGPSGSYPLPPEVPMPAPAAEPEPEPTHGSAAPRGHGRSQGHGRSHGQSHGQSHGKGPLGSQSPQAPQAQAPYDMPPAPAYTSPATRGNARITDAQRARAEGRSPIIDPGFKPALLTGVLAVLIAVAALFGPFAVVVPVVLLQAVTAAGWFRLNGMWPARQGIALAFLGGLVADIAILAVDTAQAPAAILGTLGVWVLLTVVLHLRNRMPADERMYALTAGVTTAALTVIAAGLLAADGKAATVGGAAVAAAVVARALPLPTPASLVVALLAAAGAGIAAGGANGLGGGGAVIGLGAGVCALVGLRVAAYDYPSKFVHMTAGVALPLAAAAPAVYMLGRAFA